MGPELIRDLRNLESGWQSWGPCAVCCAVLRVLVLFYHYQHLIKIFEFYSIGFPVGSDWTGWPLGIDKPWVPLKPVIFIKLIL